MIMRSREVFTLAFSRTSGEKCDWLVVVVLIHQAAILETLQHRSLTLNASIRNITDLITVKYLPVLTIVLMMKRSDVSVINKVHKGISSITLVLEVDWQIEEVHLVRSMTSFCKFVQEHLLSVSVSGKERKGMVTSGVPAVCDE